MASHSVAVQTEDKFEQPSISNSIAIETELNGNASSLTSLFTSALEVCKKADEEYHIPSISKQYVSSGGMIYYVDGVEPVPIVDKPEGVGYEIEQGGTACEEVGEQAINDNGGNNDDASKTRATSEGLFTCSHCGQMFKKEGFLVRQQKEMENEKTKREKEERWKGRNRMDDNDGDSNGGSGNGDDNDDAYTVDNDEDSDDNDEEIVNENFCHQCDKVFKKKHFLTRHKKPYLEELEQDDNEDKDDKNVDNKSESITYSHNNDKKGCSSKKKYDQRSLKCGYCEKCFTKKRNYERHVKTHITPKPLKCKNCKRVFKSEKSLNNHKKKHTEEVLKCVFCIRVVHSRYEFERHLLTHPRQKSFKCTTCFKELKSAHVFAKHLAKHKELNCDDCGKVCKNEKRFISHQEIHENPKSLEQKVHPEEEFRECYYCDMICKLSEFRSHVRTHAKKRKSQGPLECTYCGKLSNSRVSHDRHLRTHTKEKPFKCTFEDCSKTFAGKGELRIHFRRHTGDKRFKCEHCEKTFVKKWNLDEHLRTHTGARPYKCKFCEKSFGFKNVLKVHLAQHTGEKPFKCPHCENRYVKRVLLNMHLATHSGEKPFKCLQCDKAFVYSSGLREHVQVHTLN